MAQQHAPGIADLSRESESTRAAYGIGENNTTDDFGRQCLLARRLSENGVRVVQVNCTDNTTTPKWDQHRDLEKDHRAHALVAREAVGEERDRLFEAMSTSFSNFAAYQTRASHRKIPVMVHQQTIETSSKAIKLGARFVLHSTDERLLQRIIQNEMNMLRKVAGATTTAAKDTVETV